MRELRINAKIKRYAELILFHPFMNFDVAYYIAVIVTGNHLHFVSVAMLRANVQLRFTSFVYTLTIILSKCSK